jgi:ATP-binding cassette, subfamily B, bacterial
VNVQSIQAKFRHLSAQLAYAPRTLRLVWAAAPGWTVSWITLLVIQGLLPAANIYLTRLLVDGLATVLGRGVDWQTIQPTVIIGVLMVAVLLLNQVMQGILEWVRTGQSEYISDYLAKLVHEKAIAADLAYFESSEYHDRLYQASNDLKTRPLSLLESSGALVQSCITLVAMGALLIPYGLWLPLTLIASTLPAFYGVLLFNRLSHKWWQETTKDRRWAQYYSNMLTVDVVASEVRLFDLGEFFHASYQAIRNQLRAGRLYLAKQRSIVSFGASLFAMLITSIAMVWIGWRALLGFVTLGDIALFYQAFNKGQDILRNLLASVGQINSNLLFLGDLFAFLNLEPKIVDPPAPVSVPERLQEGIRFRQVTFYYPGSRRAVFKDFDFFVPANKIISIVGVNGAGKTTLVKLLCRLYDPDAGSVEFDGIDVRNMRVRELRRSIAGMFQSPVHYVATAKANITMSKVMETASESEIQDAAIQAGAHDFIMRLSKGYDTLLNKVFDQGVELSGGEWQRLALARSFFRQSPVMILDEPTSSIDSWSEIDWFERLRKLAANRTTILITHRLTIAKNADIVYVMEDGRIAESGSHEELLALGGRYANSWYAQTQQSSTEDEINLDELSVAVVPA